MPRPERVAWHSPALWGRRMELLVFGHGGARMLVFPTSMGSVHEWWDRGMMDALGEHLAGGWLQLFCVESVDAESWYAGWRAAHERAVWQAAYDRYLEREVLPYTRSVNRDPFLIAAGASFGAYHAMSFGLRHPGQVGRILAMSGMFDIRRFADGRTDGPIYAHNPAAFIPLEHDPGRLAQLRRLDIIMAVGRDDPLRPENERFSGTLWDRGVGHALRLWDGWAHDWPYWHRMVRHYVGGHD